LAMKSFGDNFISKSNTVTPFEALHHSLLRQVSAVMTRIDSSALLDLAFEEVRIFKPMKDQNIESLLGRTRHAAADGRFELFKTTSHCDATATNPSYLGRSTPS